MDTLLLCAQIASHPQDVVCADVITLKSMTFSAESLQTKPLFAGWSRRGRLLLIVRLHASEIPAFEATQTFSKSRDVSRDWLKPKNTQAYYDPREAALLQEAFVCGFKKGKKALDHFLKVCSVSFVFVCRLIT